MRKLLSVLFSTLQGEVRGGGLLFVALLATTTLWAYDFQSGDLCYNITSNKQPCTIEVTSGAYYSLTTATIPESVTYNGTTYIVTSIGDSAFWYCSSLKSISIPDGVTSIGEAAFSNCSFLTSINIPSSVTNIGRLAFVSCSSIVSITISNMVTKIDDYVFAGCSSLASISIPNSVTSIGNSAFSSCSSLTSITIPNSVTRLGDGVFYSCSSLTSITIPNSVTIIGKDAFRNCSSLTSITIPNSITSLGDGAFDWCESLTFVTIPNSVMSIGARAFSGCTSLASVSIPNSVKSIGEEAFSGCSSLTSITIPESAISIGERAFRWCYLLTLIIVNEGNTIYDSRENCNAIIETATNTLITGCSNTTIPNSVTGIGDYAFDGCKSLASISIPNSVTSIGNSAFSSCSSLTSITIPNSVTSIGYSAFSLCSSLTFITIPNSVTSIGEAAFSGCSSLTYPIYNAHCFAYMPPSYAGSYTIPEGIKQIIGASFSGCSSLTSITIPNSVESIEELAFERCSSLTSITIPNSVTSIGNRAFSSCSSLTSITIPESVTSIGNSAFSSCSSLSSITIPNSVTSIGEAAFFRCSSLTSITCEATTPPTLGSRVFYQVSTFIPVNVPCGFKNVYKQADGWKDFTNIQEPQAEYSIQVSTSNNQMGSTEVDYNNCAGSQITATANYGYHFVQWSDGNTDNPRTLILTQDTILTAEFAQSYSGQCGDNLYWSYDETAKTISITGSGNMYDYTADTQPWLLFKEQIVEVTTTNTVTSIGTSAFEGCIRLGKVTLGSSIQNIAAKAFAGCTRLYDVYCYATYPPFADAISFANYNAYLYVPCENQRDYTLDMVWGNFKFIECITSEDVSTDGVVITPTTNDVTIIWPTEIGADTYTIVIKKGNEVFCMLTFNANGQLLNIAFAPARDGNHRGAQYAEQAGNGYRFTVTGLEEGTHYAYNIDVRDAANKTIKSHAGEFTTESMTAVENITTNNANIQKILRDGQLLILRDGVEYTIMGQEL